VAREADQCHHQRATASVDHDEQYALLVSAPWTNS
jgi:hypothetical protein